MTIRSIEHENSRVWFVADDMGMPVSFGYLSRIRLARSNR